MAKLTYAQMMAFCKLVVQFLKDNAAALKASGFDTTAKTTSLETATNQAFVDDAAQEAKKAELHKATQKAVASTTAAYIQASSMMDAMVGVIGKDQTLSKQLRKIREQMSKEASRGKKQKSA
jgi:predicted transcriptional regulator